MSVKNCVLGAFYTVIFSLTSLPAAAELSPIGGQIVGYLGASGPDDLVVFPPIAPPPFPQDSVTVALSPGTLSEPAVVEFQVDAGVPEGTGPLLLSFLNQTGQTLESIGVVLGTTADNGDFLPGGGGYFSTVLPAPSPPIGNPIVVLRESYAIDIIGLEDAGSVLTVFFFGESGLRLPNESFELAVQITPTAVPEPGTAGFMMLVFGAAVARRRSGRVQ